MGIEAVGIERHGQQQKLLRLQLKDWQAEITGERWRKCGCILVDQLVSCLKLWCASQRIPSKCNKPDRFWYCSLVSYVHRCWSCQVLAHRGQWWLPPPEIWHLIWESWETQRSERIHNLWLDRHEQRWISLNFPGLGCLESRSWDWSPPEDWVVLERFLSRGNVGDRSADGAEVTRALAFTVASGAAWHALWRRWFRAGACPSAKKLWFVSRKQLIVLHLIYFTRIVSLHFRHGSSFSSDENWNPVFSKVGFSIASAGCCVDLGDWPTIQASPNGAVAVCSAEVSDSLSRWCLSSKCRRCFAFGQSAKVSILFWRPVRPSHVARHPECTECKFSTSFMQQIWSARTRGYQQGKIVQTLRPIHKQFACVTQVTSNPKDSKKLKVIWTARCWMTSSMTRCAWLRMCVFWLDWRFDDFTRCFSRVDDESKRIQLGKQDTHQALGPSLCGWEPFLVQKTIRECCIPVG